VIQDLQHTLDETRQNTGMRLILALNYGARAELVDAVQELLAQAKQNGSMTVDEALVSEHLYTRGLPDPDLLIRTSGELRLSNFLLWQVAYAELWVTETLWPDFTQKDLLQAIIDFQKRERRYGGLGMS
jgi:undecaprenyl diphosphate synthase